MSPDKVVSLFAARDGTLASLAGTGLGTCYHSWHGASGRRYIASVFPNSATPCGSPPELTGCLLLAIARRGSERDLIRVFQIERDSDRRAASTFFGPDVVDEWHVHLLASDRRARADVAADLRARHGHAVTAARA